MLKWDMEKLIFVYNADSGWHNSMMGSLHKVVSPRTYSCSLCAITFGVFSENEIWKNFREKSSVEMEFLHKDEFVKKYNADSIIPIVYPVVLKRINEGIQPFITAEEIYSLKDPQDLINVIDNKLLN